MSKAKGRKEKDDPDTRRYKMIFKLYDEDKDGFVSTDKFGEMIRAAGAAILEKELEKIQFNLQKEIKNNKFSYEQFEKCCKENINDNETVDDLINAFKFFDKEDYGKITVDELKEALTTIGDVLNEEEINALVKEADPSGTGSIDYVAFANRLMKNYL